MAKAKADTAKEGTAEAEGSDASAGGAKGAGGRKKLLLLGAPVLLLGLGAGLWFGGILPPLLGLGGAAVASGTPEQAAANPPPPPPPAFLDLPEIISNLNAPGRRASFVRLRAKIEIARADDVAAVQAAMPRLVDLFSTYLREVRPEELRGSIGTHRLREELIARAQLAVAGAPGHPNAAPRITDVLFLEILVQ